MRHKFQPFVSIVLCIVALRLSGMPVHAQGSGSATLDAVRARGQLLCGTGGEIPGFSMLDSNVSARHRRFTTTTSAIAAAVFR